MALKDITGQKFAKLTALYPTGEKSPHGRNAIWMCLCECGNHTTANTGQLKCGTKKSCGCAVIEHAGNLNKTHGGRNDRLYLVWMDMRRRCRDSKDNHYNLYGGRGISVCKEWDEDYALFREWAIKNGYQSDAKSRAVTLDRINVNGNYEPSNCRWTDMVTQNNNRRNNLRLTFNGTTQTAAEWSREKGYNKNLVAKRIKAGWSVERAITEPPRKTKRKAKGGEAA